MLLLRRTLGINFFTSTDGIIAETGGFKLHISTSQGLGILREILWDGVYNFGTAPRDVVVWDIGMNVGTASLYFATRSYVKAVLGFEPFRPNFDLAKRNLALNPELEPKVKPHNFGIAGRAYGTEMEFDPQWNASAGLGGKYTGYRDAAPVTGGSITVEHVELLAADCVLKSILEGYPKCAVVAKIDCEGSEYEIIRCLHEKQLLRELSIIILEWHERGPSELQGILHEAGFCTYSPSPANGALGKLYAVNTTRRASETLSWDRPEILNPISAH
jgi:FkbM family methyltransferase